MIIFKGLYTVGEDCVSGMNVMVVFGQMVILFCIIMIGYLIAKRKIVPAEFGKHASALIINITSPALILSAAMTDSGGINSGETLQMFVVAVLFFVLTPVVAAGLVKLLRIPKKQQNLYVYMTVFSNVGFMGFPVIESIYGKAAVFYAAIFNMVFNVFIYTLGVSLMAGDSVEKKIEIKKLMNPGILAALAACAIALLHLPVPAVLANLCAMLGDITSPLAMIVIGISLADLSFREVFREYRLYPYTIIKQLVLPILLIPVLRGVIPSESILGITIIIIAMPVATMSVIMSYTYGQDTALAAKSVFITTLATVFTIPLIAVLL